MLAISSARWIIATSTLAPSIQVIFDAPSSEARVERLDLNMEHNKDSSFKYGLHDDILNNTGSKL